MNFSDIEFCPTVHPTMKEFQDFQGYVSKLEKLYPCGLVKIIPPTGWKATKKNYDEEIQKLVVKRPFEQNFNPGPVKGAYEMMHIEKKSMKTSDYKKKAEKLDNITDGLSHEKIEQMYWRSLSFSPPFYGADVPGSLFDSGVEFNLGELRGILEEGLGDNAISGINIPYFYFGAWRTTFGWHCEDLDLPSINYNHYGKPKFWYGVSPRTKHLLEKVAKKYFPDRFARCPETMRHKTILIDPYLLKKIVPEIEIVKVLQEQGQFVITLPGCYHAGFNWGFNIAEAVNFACPGWLTVFPSAKVCKCEEDSVTINAFDFYNNLIKNNPQIKNTPEAKNFKQQLNKLEKEIEDDDEEEEEEGSGKKECPAKKVVTKGKSSRTSGIKISEKPFTAKSTKRKLVEKAKKSQSASISGGNSTKTVEVDNWIKCGNCSKWRKIPDKFDYKGLLKGQFACKAIKISCRKAEETED